MNAGEAPGKFLVNGEEGCRGVIVDVPVISHDLAARCGVHFTPSFAQPLHHCAVCTQFLATATLLS